MGKMANKQIPALILARGGSKGIPRKNLRKIGEKTLLERSVSEALKSKFSPVFVSSDDEEILKVARDCGAQAVERPAKHAMDDSSSENAVISFLEREDSAERFKELAMIQCTTPFLKASHMDAAFDLYLGGKYDSVITATRFTRFIGYEQYNKRSLFIPQYPIRNLRQNWDSVDWGVWMENGGVYLAQRRRWLMGRRVGFTCGIVEMGWNESFEIDDPEDLLVARLLAPLFLEDVGVFPQGEVSNGKKEEFKEDQERGPQNEEARQGEDGQRKDEGSSEEGVSVVCPRGLFQKVESDASNDNS